MSLFYPTPRQSALARSPAFVRLNDSEQQTAAPTAADMPAAAAAAAYTHASPYESNYTNALHGWGPGPARRLPASVFAPLAPFPERMSSPSGPYHPRRNPYAYRGGAHPLDIDSDEEADAIVFAQKARRATAELELEAPGRVQGLDLDSRPDRRFYPTHSQAPPPTHTPNPTRHQRPISPPYDDEHEAMPSRSPVPRSSSGLAASHRDMATSYAGFDATSRQASPSPHLSHHQSTAAPHYFASSSHSAAVPAASYHHSVHNEETSHSQALSQPASVSSGVLPAPSHSSHPSFASPPFPIGGPPPGARSRAHVHEIWSLESAAELVNRRRVISSQLFAHETALAEQALAHRVALAQVTLAEREEAMWREEERARHQQEASDADMAAAVAARASPPRSTHSTANESPVRSSGSHMRDLEREEAEFAPAGAPPSFATMNSPSPSSYRPGLSMDALLTPAPVSLPRDTTHSRFASSPLGRSFVAAPAATDDVSEHELAAYRAYALESTSTHRRAREDQMHRDLEVARGADRLPTSLTVQHRLRLELELEQQATDAANATSEARETEEEVRRHEAATTYSRPGSSVAYHSAEVAAAAAAAVEAESHLPVVLRANRPAPLQSPSRSSGHHHHHHVSFADSSPLSNPSSVTSSSRKAFGSTLRTTPPGASSSRGGGGAASRGPPLSLLSASQASSSMNRSSFAADDSVNISNRLDTDEYHAARRAHSSAGGAAASPVQALDVMSPFSPSRTHEFDLASPSVTRVSRAEGVSQSDMLVDQARLAQHLGSEEHQWDARLARRLEREEFREAEQRVLEAGETRARQDRARARERQATEANRRATAAALEREASHTEARLRIATKRSELATEKTALETSAAREALRAQRFEDEARLAEVAAQLRQEQQAQVEAEASRSRAAASLATTLASQRLVADRYARFEADAREREEEARRKRNELIRATHDAKMAEHEARRDKWTKEQERWTTTNTNANTSLVTSSADLSSTNSSAVEALQREYLNATGMNLTDEIEDDHDDEKDAEIDDTPDADGRASKPVPNGDSDAKSSARPHVKPVVVTTSDKHKKKSATTATTVARKKKNAVPAPMSNEALAADPEWRALMSRVAGMLPPEAAASLATSPTASTPAAEDEGDYPLASSSKQQRPPLAGSQPASSTSGSDAFLPAAYAHLRGELVALEVARAELAAGQRALLADRLTAASPDASQFEARLAAAEARHIELARELRERDADNARDAAEDARLNEERLRASVSRIRASSIERAQRVADASERAESRAKAEEERRVALEVELRSRREAAERVALERKNLLDDQMRAKEVHLADLDAQLAARRTALIASNEARLQALNGPGTATTSSTALAPPTHVASATSLAPLSPNASNDASKSSLTSPSSSSSLTSPSRSSRAPSRISLVDAPELSPFNGELVPPTSPTGRFLRVLSAGGSAAIVAAASSSSSAAASSSSAATVTAAATAPVASHPDTSSQASFSIESGSDDSLNDPPAYRFVPSALRPSIAVASVQRGAAGPATLRKATVTAAVVEDSTSDFDFSFSGGPDSNRAADTPMATKPGTDTTSTSTHAPAVSSVPQTSTSIPVVNFSLPIIVSTASNIASTTPAASEVKQVDLSSASPALSTAQLLDQRPPSLLVTEAARASSPEYDVDPPSSPDLGSLASSPVSISHTQPTVVAASPTPLINTGASIEPLPTTSSSVVTPKFAVTAAATPAVTAPLTPTFATQPPPTTAPLITPPTSTPALASTSKPTNAAPTPTSPGIPPSPKRLASPALLKAKQAKSKLRLAVLAADSEEDEDDDDNDDDDDDEDEKEVAPLPSSHAPVRAVLRSTYEFGSDSDDGGESSIALSLQSATTTSRPLGGGVVASANNAADDDFDASEFDFDTLVDAGSVKEVVTQTKPTTTTKAAPKMSSPAIADAAATSTVPVVRMTLPSLATKIQPPASSSEAPMKANEPKPNLNDDDDDDDESDLSMSLSLSTLGEEKLSSHTKKAASLQRATGGTSSSTVGQQPAPPAAADASLLDSLLEDDDDITYELSFDDASYHQFMDTIKTTPTSRRDAKDTSKPIQAKLSVKRDSSSHHASANSSSTHDTSATRNALSGLEINGKPVHVVVAAPSSDNGSAVAKKNSSSSSSSSSSLSPSKQKRTSSVISAISSFNHPTAVSNDDDDDDEDSDDDAGGLFGPMGSLARRKKKVPSVPAASRSSTTEAPLSKQSGSSASSSTPPAGNDDHPRAPPFSSAMMSILLRPEDPSRAKTEGRDDDMLLKLEVNDKRTGIRKGIVAFGVQMLLDAKIFGARTS